MRDAAEFVRLMEPIARHFFGEPNTRLSNLAKHELRFGNRGSLSIDLRKGTFFDNELNKGGGVLDLIERETGRQGAERHRWLKENGFLPNGEDHSSTAFNIVATYDYTNESGTLIFQVCRLDPKDFRQRKPDPNKPGGWDWRTRGVQQVPYRLPDVLEAISLGKTIFIVEGERDVNNLWAIGVPATCNAGGAGRWRPELNKWFEGADVIVVPDIDPQKLHPKTAEPMFHSDGRPILPGQDHAAEVLAALKPIADRVRYFDLKRVWPEIPAKGDISDWLQAGHGADELYAIAEALPDWDRSTYGTTATRYITPNPADIPPRAWLHAGHYNRQTVSATVSPGGYGKSSLAIHEAVKMVAAGLSVWLISGEDPKVELDRRIAAHCQEHGVNLAALPGRFFVDDRLSFPLAIAAVPKPGKIVFDEQALQNFEMAIADDKIDAVLLDPWVSFHAVPESDNNSVDAVVKRLATIAIRVNCAIETCHHVRKAFSGQAIYTVDDARGASALINACRSARVINRMTLTEAEQAHIDKDQRSFYIRLDLGKANMRPPAAAVWFKLVNVIIANGDHVQALTPWKFPDLFEGISAEDTDWVRALVRRQPYRCDSRSPDWLGIPIAQRLKLDVHDDSVCKRINKWIGIWVTNKVLRKAELKDPESRKPKMFYVSVTSTQDDNVIPFPMKEDEDE
jgi:AAA domain